MSDVDDEDSSDGTNHGIIPSSTSPPEHLHPIHTKNTISFLAMENQHGHATAVAIHQHYVMIWHTQFSI